MKRASPIIFIIITIFVCIVLSGCNSLDFTKDNFSTEPMRATIGYTTALHDELVSMPPPEEKIIVAVYKFRDQTGQYKTSSTATTFSTAVTQGATSMLTKVLEDSGWFIPIEREGLANLLNERKIIRSSRLQYESESGESAPALPPLLYAGVLLEGGIISYDTNFITGGAGLRYFGVGGSGQFRKDRVAIYLRLVSVKNGEVLKTVSTTKSVLSKEVDFNVYRFVSVEKLFEAETGFSTNEPPSMCVLEAIEKAVLSLIIEGIEEGLWGLKNPQDINSPVIQTFLEERKQKEMMVAFNKKGDLIEVQAIEEEQKDPESISSHLKTNVRELPVDRESGIESINLPETRVDEEPAPKKNLDESGTDVVEVAEDTPKEVVKEQKDVIAYLNEIVGKSNTKEYAQASATELPRVSITEPGKIFVRPAPSLVEVTENPQQGIVEEKNTQLSSTEGNVNGGFIITDLVKPGTESSEAPAMKGSEESAPEKILDESGPYIVEVTENTSEESGEDSQAVISYLQEVVGIANTPDGDNIGSKFVAASQKKPEETLDAPKTDIAKKPQKESIEKSETAVTNESKPDKSIQTIVGAIRKSSFFKDLLTLNQKYLGLLSTTTRKSSDRSHEQTEEEVK